MEEYKLSNLNHRRQGKKNREEEKSREKKMQWTEDNYQDIRF